MRLNKLINSACAAKHAAVQATLDFNTVSEHPSNRTDIDSAKGLKTSLPELFRRVRSFAPMTLTGLRVNQGPQAQMAAALKEELHPEIQLQRRGTLGYFRGADSDVESLGHPPVPFEEIAQFRLFPVPNEQT